jgi:hypothetical protein
MIKKTRISYNYNWSALASQYEREFKKWKKTLKCFTLGLKNAV